MEDHWWETKTQVPVEENPVVEELIQTHNFYETVPMTLVYTKQKSLAIALFVISFIAGDWWWDGSNGFLALIESAISISEMPTWIPDAINQNNSIFGSKGIFITISWVLWQISPIVFFLGFALSWRGPFKIEVGTEELEKHKKSGKESYKFLLYFSILLFLMDFITYLVVWNQYDWYIDIIEYLLNWYNFHFWKILTFCAVIGLNPDKKWSYKR